MIFRNRLKKLNFCKTFEDIIENELDFHDYGTAKIKIQQLPRDINPFTCELHQIMFDILDFNPALTVINITPAYKNHENDIIVCTTSPLSDGGIEPPTKFLKKGGEGFTGSQFLKGVAGNGSFNRYMFMWLAQHGYNVVTNPYHSLEKIRKNS